MEQRTITLRPTNGQGDTQVPEHAGGVLLNIRPAIRLAVSVAFRGKSKAAGRCPRWLAMASDVRFLGAEVCDGTRLSFTAPSLGEAAPDLYDQQEFWDARPPEAFTGFELLSEAIADIAALDDDSDRYDDGLLRHLARFQRTLDRFVGEIVIEGKGCRRGPETTLNLSILDKASSLLSTTPQPQAVRVVGSLDMIRASTRTFELRLDGGMAVRGVLNESQPLDVLRDLFQQRVVVGGLAIYRPSGNLLRIDAEMVASGSDESSLFSQLPPPPSTRLDAGRLMQPQGSRSGVAAFLGTWPGEENDEEWFDLAEQVS